MNLKEKKYLQFGFARFKPGAACTGFSKIRIKPITKRKVRRRPEFILDTRKLRIIRVFISGWY